jgi:hypothetical protein
MTELSVVSDVLESVRVEAAVAGGMVLLELSGLRDLRVTISEAYYRETPEARVAADLGRAIRLLVARRQDAVEKQGVGSGHAVDLVAGSELAQRIDEFNRANDEFTTEVATPDGSLRVGTVGMREFVVEIAPGTSARQPASELARAAERLGLDLIARRVRATTRLRMEAFERELEAQVLAPR